MKTNKEIVTEIIDNLDIAFIPRARITKIALIECWSEYRRESDYKYYKYTASESASRIYIRMFKSITNKPSAEKWKS